jgi:4-hydroxybenzoate polyprenyltransferase
LVLVSTAVFANRVSIMLRSLRSFLELIRFSHTIFALPFALTSASLAWSRSGFDSLQLAGILLCMVFARSAAMAFNRLADRRFDAANPRTAGRHLPAGLLSPRRVWAFTLACSLGFVLSSALFLVRNNPWPLILSGPVLLFLCTYSLTKRFTSLSHFWLGSSLFLAPVAAWIAIRGLPGWPEALTPLLLGGAVLFWVAGFDMIYSCQDHDFDRRAKLRSIPAAVGVKASLRIALVCHLVMLAMLLGLYAASEELGGIYLGGVAAVALLLCYEHWLVRPDDLSRVNRAFFQVNGVISVGLFLLVLVQLAARSML